MKYKLLISFVALFLFNANILFGQDSSLIEQFKQALVPQASPNSSPSHNTTRSINSTRGIKGIISESEQNTEGAKEPSLTLQLEFRSNSDELAPQTVKYLDALGTALQDQKLRGYIYKVEGYTDNVGNDSYNLELSRKRALAVTDYMVRTFNLDKQQFDVEGFGKNSPVASNETEEGRSKNRRVVVINTLKPFDALAIKRPDINVRVKYARAKEERELNNGETLTQRDNYAIEFTPKTSAFVYVYQVDTMGTITTLFPNPEFSHSSNSVEPGRLYRVPDFGKWLYLDDSKGKEQIVVVAQKEQLKDPQKICQREIGSNDLSLASAKPLTGSSRGTTTRGLGGTRQQSNVGNASLPTAPKPDIQDIDMNQIFVWKISFMHQ